MPDGCLMPKAHRLPFRKPRKGHMRVVIYAPIDHAPDDLCGGRRLAGKEFLKRKAELEAIDQLERNQKKTVLYRS